MKKNSLILLSLLIIVSSCSIDKRIARKQAKWCDKFASVDSIIVERYDSIVIEKLDTIRFAPKTDTIRIKSTAYCDSLNNANMSLISIINDNYKADIEIVDNELKAEIICNSDSLEVVIKEKEKTIRKLKDNKSVKKELRYKTVGKFYVWYFWITLSLIVIWLIFKLK